VVRTKNKKKRGEREIRKTTQGVQKIRSFGTVAIGVKRRLWKTGGRGQKGLMWKVCVIATMRKGMKGCHFLKGIVPRSLLKLGGCW